ncbi:MAG: xanthine dehydrogenase family protein molybdopterin-binding subunit [Gammaproteobacteria bacterium]|nr:xanthine dehydrogenase family protein molybdopterin-binding subunit [Gammaproteobacteria bacterium]
MNKPEKLPHFRVVGTNPIRPDGLDKVTGRAVYGDDFKIAGMLHGKVLRSPHAHARIKSIDTRRAAKLPGVRAIITGADFPKPSVAMVPMGEGGYVDMNDTADNVIAKGKAFYDGHVIAAVAADNPHIAEEAVALIDVKYEVLPPVMDVRSAMAPGAAVLHETFNPGAFFMKTHKVLPNASRLELGAGDVARGFKEADVIVEREFTTETVHQGYIESHICTAQWDERGQVTIWTTTQGAFAIRDQVAIVCAVPMSHVRVVPLEIGGGFGGKDTAYIEPLAAMLAKKADRPVKVVMSRAESLRATGPSSGTFIRAKMGAKKDGTLVAADLSFAYEAGGFPGGPIAAGVLTSITRYNIPNVRLEGFDVLVNKPKVKPYRAPGATQSNFAVEQVMNQLAEKLGMDPVEFRIRNAMKTGDRLILGFPCPPVGGVEMLEAVKKHPHYKAPLGKNQGRGVAFSFWFGAGLTSSAELSVNSDGTVQMCTGSCDLSGTRLTLAMQAAEALGIDVEDVSPTIGDTHSVGYTLQSVGSRTTFATGIAVYEAAQKVLKEMAGRAALLWETDPANVAVDRGDFTDMNNPAHRFTFRELADKLEHSGGPVSAQSTVTPERVGFQLAAHLVDIEVDTETGKVDILRYTAFQDAGKAVHPDFVAGQIQGGVVQGLGWALNEEFWYDAKGRLCNASLLDYRMPIALDVPMIDVVILETPNPGHPFGVRGVGEVPIVPPAAAVANAIYDAIGVRMDALPMKPGRVLQKIKEQKSAAA